MFIPEIVTTQIVWNVSAYTPTSLKAVRLLITVNNCGKGGRGGGGVERHIALKGAAIGGGSWTTTVLKNDEF